MEVPNYESDDDDKVSIKVGLLKMHLLLLMDMLIKMDMLLNTISTSTMVNMTV